MASLNRVQIIGNLGQDPELRYTQNQTAVCTLNIATTEYRSGGENGEKEATTTWHRVVAWSKQAENCSKFLAKGRQVYVEGRLQTRQWEDQNGNKRYTTEIVAQNVLFLGSGGRTQNVDAGGFESQGNSGGFSGGNNNSGGNNTPSPAVGIDPSLDEIPF